MRRPGGGLVASSATIGFVGRGEAEDVVDVADDGAPFAFGELAFGVADFLEFGAGSGVSVAIFLDDHCFAAGAGECVDEADEAGAVTAEPGIKLAFLRMTAGGWRMIRDW